MELHRDFVFIYYFTNLCTFRLITVAITKSIPEAPYILQNELEKLVESLREDPNNPELFFNFLSEYDIPGVKDTMCMMVSLNSGIGGDKKMQMEALVKANTNMIDKEDQISAKTNSKNRNGISIIHYTSSTSSLSPL